MYEKHMNAEEMAQYVRGPMDSMNAWAIAYEYYDSYGKKMRTREGVVSANGLRGIANYRYRDQKIRAWPVERVLLKTNINKIGKQYFWTKEECQEAIDEALREG